MACCVLSADAQPDPLLLSEAASVARAIPRRQREFALGRTALRRALAVVGHHLPAAQAIPAGPDRRPVLPPGIAASLSHTQDLCIAVAARDPILSPGVDIERLAEAPHGLDDLVRPFAADLPDFGGLLAFSVKEAIYKSQYPHSGQLLEFSDAALVLRPGFFRARLACGAFLSGRWGIAAGHVLAISYRANSPASIAADRFTSWRASTR